MRKSKHRTYAFFIFPKEKKGVCFHVSPLPCPRQRACREYPLPVGVLEDLSHLAYWFAVVLAILFVLCSLRIPVGRGARRA